MEERRTIFEKQLGARGLHDGRVLDALAVVPREEFVPHSQKRSAYLDGPLSIGHGQTISQPYIVASMTSALELTGADRALEVGSGSGYAAAVLSRIAAEVFTVERIPELAEMAEARFERLGYSNIRVMTGDGSLGWPEKAPFDAIVVSAAGPEVPDALLEQLGEGGRLVMPVGGRSFSQVLIRIRRNGSKFERETLEGVRFVPLIGEQGWSE